MKPFFRIEYNSISSHYDEIGRKTRRWRIWLVDSTGDEWMWAWAPTREHAREYVKRASTQKSLKGM